jgi:thioredoxin 1
MAMPEKITEITNTNFDDTVIKSEKPVLVDFWAEWCTPCRMLSPVVDEIAQNYEGKILVGKINIDEQEALAQKFGVMSIPTLILFKDGKAVQKSVGVVGKDKIKNMIDTVL